MMSERMTDDGHSGHKVHAPFSFMIAILTKNFGLEGLEWTFTELLPLG